MAPPDGTAALAGVAAAGALAPLVGSQVPARVFEACVAAGARLKLGHLGIESFFAFGGFGDDHVDRNDIAAEALSAADAYLRSQHHVHADPQRTTVIGDTPHDVRCARSISARAIAVATGGASMSELAAESPDLLVRDLSDGDAILEIVTRE